MSAPDPETLRISFQLMDYINGRTDYTDMDTALAKMSVDELRTLRTNCQSLHKTGSLTSRQNYSLNKVLNDAQNMERTLREQNEASAVPLPGGDNSEKSQPSDISSTEDRFHELAVVIPPPSPYSARVASPDFMERLVQALAVLSELREFEHSRIEAQNRPSKISENRNPSEKKKDDEFETNNSQKKLQPASPPASMPHPGVTSPSLTPKKEGIVERISNHLQRFQESTFFFALFLAVGLAVALWETYKGLMVIIFTVALLADKFMGSGEDSYFKQVLSW